MDVAIKNPKTGEIKNIKIGWSWTLFLFSGFFGVPLFLRRLYAWGALLLALWIVQIAVPPLLPLVDQVTFYVVLTLLFLGIQIFLGIKGNEMTAKNYLENTWIFSDEASQAANFARQNWNLSTSTGATGIIAGAPSERAATTTNFPSSNRNSRKPLLWLLLPLGCIVIAAILWRGNMFQSALRSAATTADGGKEHVRTPLHVGDTFRTNDFAIKIKSVDVTRRVGGALLTSEASQGAEYIAIQWAYKNVSRKPIDSTDIPSIHLVAPDGTVYDTDDGASASFATQVGDDTKVLSDLNPGIQSAAADVFEVSRQLFDADKWRILVKADQDVEIALNQSPPGSEAQVAASVPALPAASEKVTSNTSASAQSDVTEAAGTATPAVTPVSTSALATPSFDCAKASSVVEKLICANPELATADAEMASIYKKNIAASGADSAQVKQGQRAFISARNQCSTVACVAEAYRARYEELGQLGYVRE